MNATNPMLGLAWAGAVWGPWTLVQHALTAGAALAGWGAFLFWTEHHHRGRETVDERAGHARDEARPDNVIPFPAIPRSLR